MRVDEWIAFATSELEASGIESAKLDAEILVAHALGVERLQAIIHPERKVEDKVVRPLLERRLRGEPVAYIIGYKEFYGRKFLVDSNVLIPRPETETLVQVVLEGWGEGLVCVDVGTGSGAIAVTLALETGERVAGTDVSRKALEVAVKNASQHFAMVELVQMDCLSAFAWESLDVVVSNPPYVSPDDPRLAKEVVDWEPSIALFSERGIGFIERLVREAYKCLRPGGMLAVEVGEGQSEEVFALMHKFRNVAAKCDLSGICRVITGRKL